MKVTSSAIINGIIADEYGKRGEVNSFGMPVTSLPLAFSEYPETTKSFAVFIEDKDAIPVSGGFSWIHWTVTNIIEPELVADAARTNPNLIQGVNSWISMQGGNQDAALCATYGGMAPPNGDHHYDIHVYALDTLLTLESGFYPNELFHAMHNHIVEITVLRAIYHV